MKNVEERIADLKEFVSKPWDAPVKYLRREFPGNKIVACFPVYTPVELFHAAGAFPVGLFGAGGHVELVSADSRFVSFVCSIAKSTLELGLQNYLSKFDGIVFHSICDVARNLSYVMQRNLPSSWVEYIHLPQNPEEDLAAEYFYSELIRVKTKLEQLCETEITNESLARSIALYNRARQSLGALYLRRSQAPERMTLSELAVLTRAFTCMPPDEFNQVAIQMLDEVERRQGIKRDRILVVLEGSFCEQPPFDLLDCIEEAGCYVVDNDLASGWRWYGSPIIPGNNPLRALAEAYVKNSRHSSIRHDQTRPRHKELVKRVRENKADAVIFCIAKFCEPALFDYVIFKKELEKEGIPHLVIEFEEKMWTFERVRNEVETFAESLLFA